MEKSIQHSAISIQPGRVVAEIRTKPALAECRVLNAAVTSPSIPYVIPHFIFE